VKLWALTPHYFRNNLQCFMGAQKVSSKNFKFMFYDACLSQSSCNSKYSFSI